MTIADEPSDGPDPRRRAASEDAAPEGAASEVSRSEGAHSEDSRGEDSLSDGSPSGASAAEDAAGGSTSDAGTSLDYDARFADIVARWSDHPVHPADRDAAPAPHPHDGVDPAAGFGPHGPLPDRSDIDRFDVDRSDIDGSHVDGSVRPRPDDGVTGVNPPLSQAVPFRQHIPPPEPEEDFHPAAPAPLPRGDLGFWGAMLGVTLGPLWLIYLVVTNPYGSRLEMGLALVMAVGGFALIVARLPRRHRDEDVDDDDGAVV